MDQTSLILLIFVLATSCLLAVLLFIYVSNKKKSDVITVKEKGGSKNYFIFIYRFWQNVPGFRRVFRKIYRQVEITYPADAVSVKKQVTKILVALSVIGVGGIALSIIISAALVNSSLYFTLCGFMLTALILNAYVNGRLAKLKEKLLLQFADFLTKMRHAYHETPIIDVALQNTLDEIPYEIRLHVAKIADIISDPDMNERIDEYIGKEPSQYILMFLSMCASVKEYGDRKTESGQSVFLTNLNYLKEEVNNEVLGRRRNRAAFAMIPAMVLMPIILVPIMQRFAENNFEGISDYYAGIAGVISMIVVFVVCIGAYELIVLLRDGGETAEKDTDIWARLAQIPLLNRMASAVVNRNYTKYRRYNDMARGMGDHTGMKAFFTKRFVMAVAAGVLTLVIFISGVLVARVTLLRSWSSEFKDSMAPSEEYTAAMRDVGEEYAMTYRKNEDISSDAFKKKVAEHIKETTDITSDTLAEEVATEVSTKLTKYQKTYFKWWELLISIGVALMFYFIPVWYLKYKQGLINMRKEGEIVRFQSMVLILMHMEGTTLETILEWMERFSYCFKETISECRIALPRGSQDALENMKNAEPFESFKDFTDNLIAIDKVGVEEAFDEVQTDRSYFIRKREEDRVEMLDKKLARAHRIMYVPLFLTIALYLIVPMSIYMLDMFQEMRSVL